MPTTQETNITNLLSGVRVETQVWRYEGTATFDPNTATTGWLPSAPWVDRTALVSDGAGIGFGHDGKGPDLALTVRGVSRASWGDGTYVALLARAWDGTAWSAWKTVILGTVVGDSRQRRRGPDQTTTVHVAITHRWARSPIPALLLGRHNAAKGSSAPYGTPGLPTPSAEVPMEYNGQADTLGTQAVDGQINTVAVGNAIADPARPALGWTSVPRIYRFQNGHIGDRAIGAGGQPIYIELYQTDNVIPWGTSWVGVPDMYNAGAGEGQPAVREDARIKISIVTYGDGTKGLQVVAKANANPLADTWIQWIIYSSYVNRPAIVDFEIKAGSGPSIGKTGHCFITDATPQGGNRTDIRPLVFGNDWQYYKADISSTTQYGGIKFNLKTTQGESVGGDVIYEIRNLRFLVGWDQDVWGAANDFRSTWLGIDDGNGHQRWTRIAWELATGGNWAIKPLDTAVICDDLGSYKRVFSPGDRSIWQLKNANQYFYAAPGTGRIRLCLMQNPPDKNNIYSLPGDAILTEDIDFTVINGGVPWTSDQALTRQNPSGTGFFAVDQFPQPGFETTRGAVYWVWKLPDVAPDTLSADMTATSLRVPVNDPTRWPDEGFCQVGSEKMWYTGKDNGWLVLANLTRRGISSTTPAQHFSGDAVYQLYDGNAYPGTTQQIGHLIDAIEVRRKPGKPRILAGELGWSNLVAPGDPNVGGSKWRHHPDWNLATSWADNLSEVIQWQPPLAPLYNGAHPVRQMTHLYLRIDRQEPSSGIPQRGKVNEVVAWEFSPEGNAAGAYRSTGVSDLTGVVGYILVNHAGLAAGKYATLLPSLPVGEVSIAEGSVEAAISAIVSKGLAVCYADGLGYVTLGAAPNSSLFDARDAVWTWTDSNCWGAEQAGDWSPGQKVAQVILWGTESNSLRQHRVAYPATRLQQGEVVNVKDVFVLSRQHAEELAHSMFRGLNARRGLTITAGYCPWLAPYQRHVVNFPRLDPGGEWSGVNFYVADYKVQFKGRVARTSITLREMGL